MTNESLWTIGVRIRLTGDGANATDQALCGWVCGMVSLKMVFTSHTFLSKSRQHEQDAKRISADTEVLKATYTRLGVVGLTWLHFNFIGSQWISWLSDSWVVTEGFVGCPGMWTVTRNGADALYTQAENITGSNGRTSASGVFVNLRNMGHQKYGLPGLTVHIAEPPFKANQAHWTWDP